ncbi:MAG: hypothetical protein K9L17_10860 [Clostridiales bacterium]|nr:hypothetical protein [Clostridiales bacterium]MCF8023181.1 hypothetical protein [Clostridiales bacterium]
MFLTDRITEMSNEMMNEHMENVKNDPEKYDKVLQMSIKGMELGIIYLRENKQFREVFANLHAEFLKYPECRKVINDAFNS